MFDFGLHFGLKMMFCQGNVECFSASNLKVSVFNLVFESLSLRVCFCNDS